MSLTTDLSWVKTHLILLAIVIVLAFGSVYGVETLLANRTAANDAKMTAILASQTAQTQSVLKQLQTDEAQWAQVQQQMLAMNATLTNAMLQRRQQTQIQIQKDVTLNASGAAARLTTQLGAHPGEIAASGNNVVVDLGISRVLVAALDHCQETDADLIDTQKQLTNETVLFENSQKNVAEQTTLIADLKQQNEAQKVADAATIKNLKAQARKSKMRWFGLGFVAGFISSRWL